MYAPKVFVGDFTRSEDKEEIVDVVLGLYAMVLQSREQTGIRTHTARNPPMSVVPYSSPPK